MSETTTLEVFTDFVCPWCYLCIPRVKTLEKNFAIDVQWTYFPLHPETPLEGMTLKDLFAGRNFDLDAAHARLKSLMDAEGLAFNQRSHTYNSGWLRNWQRVLIARTCGMRCTGRTSRTRGISATKRFLSISRPRVEYRRMMYAAH